VKKHGPTIPKPNILLQNVNPVPTIGAHQYGMCCVCVCYIEACNVINCFIFVVVVPVLKSEEAHVNVIEFWTCWWEQYYI